MIFDEELTLLKEKIANAEDVDELNYIRTTNQKKYWWTSIFIAGLFYGLNGKVGKMIITWFVSVITLESMHYTSFIEAIKMKPNSIIRWNIIYYKEAKN